MITTTITCDHCGKVCNPGTYERMNFGARIRYAHETGGCRGGLLRDHATKMDAEEASALAKPPPAKPAAVPVAPAPAPAAGHPAGAPSSSSSSSAAAAPVPAPHAPPAPAPVAPPAARAGASAPAAKSPT